MILQQHQQTQQSQSELSGIIKNFLRFIINVTTK